MKLYVWEGVLCDYTCGVAFAFAENEDQAWELLKQANDTAHWVLSGGSGDERSEPRIVEQPEGFAVWGGG